ncbi:MAG: ABC transporter substrate-binding protein [Actinomycetota bacterium]
MWRPRAGALVAALIALALMAAACGGSDDRAATKGTITVGAVTFAENQIVAEMYAQVLEKAGYRVERQLNIGSREILQPALQKGDIDIAPEYLGSLLVFLDPKADPSSDPEQIVGPLEKALEARRLVLLRLSRANDTTAFVVTRATAGTHGLRKVSDLAAVAEKLTLGGPAECPERPFCLLGLERTYGIKGLKFQPIGVCNTPTAQALEAGKVDIALLCSTQAIISEKDWVVLEDDKGLQKADNIAPVVNRKALNPEIEQLLNGVSSKLTTENLTKLNARVELRREDPAQVARDFLKEQGLL